MAGNPLSSPSLAVFMAASLPTASTSKLNTPYDAIALLCHSAMIAVGFTLIGLDEEHRLDTPSSAASLHPLPQEWNAQKETSSFRYSHPQSSLRYLLKISRLGSKAVVFGLGIGDDKTASFDVAVSDYLSPNSFPFALTPSNSTTGDADAGITSDTDQARTTSATTELQQEITNLFLSPARLADLASLLKINILQKLIPGLQKAGYDPGDSAGTAAPSASSRVQDAPIPAPSGGRGPVPAPDHPPRPYPFHDPLAAGPSRSPFPAGDFPPPGFEDEHEILRRPGQGVGGLGDGGRNPLSIGHDDLYPPGLAPHDPLRGSFVPGGGVGGIGGGGMHPTFDDPLFAGRAGQQGRGRDPRVPEGARYDPVGPGDEPFGGLGMGGPRFPGGRGGGSGGGGFGGGFGGGDFI